MKKGRTWTEEEKKIKSMQMKQAMTMELRLTYEQSVWESRRVRILNLDNGDIYESTKELLLLNSTLAPASYFRAQKKAIDGVIRVMTKDKKQLRLKRL